MTSPPPAPGHVALLPCPFCGAQPNPGGPYPENYEGPIRYFGEGGVRIECTACGARSRIVPPEHAMSEPEAIGAWNRRAPSPLAEAPQEAMPHLNPRYMVPEITRKAPHAASEAVPADDPMEGFLTPEQLKEQAEIARNALQSADHRYSDGCARVHVNPVRYLAMIGRCSAPSTEASVERLVKAAQLAREGLLECVASLTEKDATWAMKALAHIAVEKALAALDPALSAFGAAEGGER